MRRADEDLPDGWIRTPLPPDSRGAGPDGRDRGWFARTGEPAPPRKPSTPEPMPELQRLAIAISLLAILAALALIAAWFWLA